MMKTPQKHCKAGISGRDTSAESEDKDRRDVHDGIEERKQI